MGRSIQSYWIQGAQMSTITISQAKKMGLEIKSLESWLDIEGGGGIAIPYIGYVEVNLQLDDGYE